MNDYKAELEAVKDERDALAAHLHQIRHAFNRYDLADYCSDEEIAAEGELYDLMEQPPTTTLARLKAQWQAEALDEGLVQRAIELEARYSMDAGQADQRRAESRAVRKALGFEEDADDVSPRDLLDALARLKAQWQAEALEEALGLNDQGVERKMLELQRQAEEPTEAGRKG